MKKILLSLSLIILVVIIVFIFSNPSLNAFKEFVPSVISEREFNIGREANYFVYSKYKLTLLNGEEYRYNGMLGNFYEVSHDTSKKSEEKIEVIYEQNMDSVKIEDLKMKYKSALNDIEGLKGQNISLDSLLLGLEFKMLNFLKEINEKEELSDGEYLERLKMLQSLIAELKSQITELENEIRN